jgi:hypothetical protein
MFSRYLHLDSYFTAENDLHVCSRLVTRCNELLYIISFDLHTPSMTPFDATEHNLLVSHLRFIWTLFLLLNTF